MVKDLKKDQVEQQQMKRILDNQLFPNMISSLCAVILAFSQWLVVSHVVIISWFLFTLISYGIMWTILFSYLQKKPQGQEILSWRKKLLFATFFFSLVWGSSSIFLFPSNASDQQFFFALIIAGVCSGTVISLSSQWKTILVVISVIIIPLTVQFVLEAGILQKVVAIALVMYYFFLLYVAKYNNNIINEIINLRLKTDEQEKELKVFEKRYEEFIENLPVGVFRCKFSDKDNFILVNTSLVKMLGYNTKEDLYKIDINSLCADPLEYKIFRIKLISYEITDLEKIRLRKNDGSDVVFEVTARVIRNREGELEHFDGIIKA